MRFVVQYVTSAKYNISHHVSTTGEVGDLLEKLYKRRIPAKAYNDRRELIGLVWKKARWDGWYDEKTKRVSWWTWVYVPDGQKL